MEKPKEYEINKLIKQIKEFKKKAENYFSNCCPEDYWGMCSECFQNGEEFEGLMLNIGRNHFMCCHKHQTFWSVGSNLFSYWHHENEEIWQRNEELLSTYTEIESLTISHLFNFFEIENLKRENAELKEMLKEKAGIDIDAERLKGISKDSLKEIHKVKKIFVDSKIEQITKKEG